MRSETGMITTESVLSVQSAGYSRCSDRGGMKELEDFQGNTGVEGSRRIWGCG